MSFCSHGPFPHPDFSVRSNFPRMLFPFYKCNTSYYSKFGNIIKTKEERETKKQKKRKRSRRKYKEKIKKEEEKEKHPYKIYFRRFFFYLFDFIGIPF